jgi:hypothetical protein
VATLISSRAVDKDIELIVRIDPALPARLIGDVGRVRQIITNLAGNAIKFTETGHVLIEVTGNAASARKCRGSCNSGPRHRHRNSGRQAGSRLRQVLAGRYILNPPARGNRPRAGHHLAPGRSDGRPISAESTPGEGSVFCVKITCRSITDGRIARIAPIDVSGARVLVIDDNPVNREILIEQLTAWGFDACAAVSGEEGLEVLAASDRFGVPVNASSSITTCPIWTAR